MPETLRTGEQVRSAAPAVVRSLALGTLAALLVPAPASAATASIVIVPGPCDYACSKYTGDPGMVATLRYVAAAGEVNAVSLSLQGDTVLVRDDGAPVTPGENCT